MQAGRVDGVGRIHLVSLVTFELVLASWVIRCGHVWKIGACLLESLQQALCMVYASLSVGGACLFECHPASDALARIWHLAVMALFANLVSCYACQCHAISHPGKALRRESPRVGAGSAMLHSSVTVHVHRFIEA